MGWWSTTIMGGDTPLDYRGFIEEALLFENKLGKSILDMRPSKKWAGILEEHYNDLFDNVNYDDPSIFAQVLTVIMMHHGTVISPERKKQLIDLIKMDEWAGYDNDRQEEIYDLIAKLESYTGRSVNVRREGLFDVLGKHLSEGKTGLVNKNIGGRG